MYSLELKEISRPGEQGGVGLPQVTGKGAYARLQKSPAFKDIPASTPVKLTLGGHDKRSSASFAAVSVNGRTLSVSTGHLHAALLAPKIFKTSTAGGGAGPVLRWGLTGSGPMRDVCFSLTLASDIAHSGGRDLLNPDDPDELVPDYVCESKFTVGNDFLLTLDGCSDASIWVEDLCGWNITQSETDELTLTLHFLVEGLIGAIREHNVTIEQVLPTSAQTPGGERSEDEKLAQFSAAVCADNDAALREVLKSASAESLKSLWLILVYLRTDGLRYTITTANDVHYEDDLTAAFLLPVILYLWRKRGFTCVDANSSIRDLSNLIDGLTSNSRRLALCRGLLEKAVECVGNPQAEPDPVAEISSVRDSAHRSHRSVLNIFGLLGNSDLERCATEALAQLNEFYDMRQGWCVAKQIADQEHATQGFGKGGACI